MIVRLGSQRTLFIVLKEQWPFRSWNLGSDVFWLDAVVDLFDRYLPHIGGLQQQRNTIAGGSISMRMWIFGCEMIPNELRVVYTPTLMPSYGYTKRNVGCVRII